jgi:pyridoxamine 5'-phosphate oxidase
MDFEQLREEYERAGLSEERCAPDPIEQFRAWFDEAREAGIYLPDAVVLATAGPDAVPNARVVVLRGLDARGFVLFTSYRSAKAADLESNPRAALVFHWNDLERQVRVRGPVVRLSREESEAYFRTRPRASRIAAWASPQSEVVSDRAFLEARYEEVERRFRDREIPAPADWGGYRLAPAELEFWQGRPRRLHDRLRYSRPDPAGPWRIERIAP